MVSTAFSDPGGGALAVAGSLDVTGASVVGCFSRRKRRSERWPPRCRRRAAPVGAGLRVWTATRRHDRWRFLRRYSAAAVSHSRVCPYELDSGPGCAAVAGVAVGRRVAGHPWRGPRHRCGAGRGGRDGDLHRSQQRVRQRGVRLRPTRNHRRDRRTGHRLGGTGIPIQVDHLDIAAGACALPTASATTTA